MTPNERPPPPQPSLEEVLARIEEVLGEVHRVASATATGTLYVGRAVRIMEANETLSARERVAIVAAAEDIKKSSGTSQRVMVEIEKMLRRFAAEPSVTVVRDVPNPIEHEKSEKRETTGLFYVAESGDLRKLRIPIRTKFVSYVLIILAVGLFIAGIFAGRAGVQPKTVVQYGVHALGVP